MFSLSVVHVYEQQFGYELTTSCSQCQAGPAYDNILRIPTANRVLRDPIVQPYSKTAEFGSVAAMPNPATGDRTSGLADVTDGVADRPLFQHCSEVDATIHGNTPQNTMELAKHLEACEMVEQEGLNRTRLLVLQAMTQRSTQEWFSYRLTRLCIGAFGMSRSFCFFTSKSECLRALLACSGIAGNGTEATAGVNCFDEPPVDSGRSYLRYRAGYSCRDAHRINDGLR